MIRRYYFLFFIILGYLPSGVSQHLNFKFRTYGINEGLSQSTVLSVFQDSKGFIWMGTRDGLNKFDGYKFTVYKYNSKNKNSISSNFVKKIIEDREGNLWIATEIGGLNKFDPRKEKFYHYKFRRNDPFSLSENVLNTIFMDSYGDIWVGTENKGLNKYDKKNDNFIRYSKGENSSFINDNCIKSIAEDEDKNLWLGTGKGGLNKFDRVANKFTYYTHDPTNERSISSNIVWSVFVDSKNNVWVGTYGQGLNLFNKKSGSFVKFNDPATRKNINSGFVVAISEDDKGNIWFGIENGGLLIYNPGKKQFSNIFHDGSDANSISSNSIHSIYKDNKGNMWIGTFGGGACMFDSDGNKFMHYKNTLMNPNSLSDNKVTSIFEDSEKKIWIGTDGGGVNYFDPVTEKITYLQHEPENPNSIAGDYVLKVLEDSKKNIWIGTYGTGVTCYDRKNNSFKQFKITSDPNSIDGNDVWAIIEDKNRNIWIGTFGGGLNLYDAEKGGFKKYNAPGTFINVLYEDRKGRLWIGDNVKGLHLFDVVQRRYLQFPYSKKLENKSIISINEDNSGNLLIGTRSGLFLLNIEKNTLASYTTQEGLPNDVIQGTLTDNKGNVWISTNNGLSKFTPSSKSFKNYTISDGLQSYEFREGAYCLATDGSMYFGGVNGFNRFFPDSVKNTVFTPPLVFTELQIFNKEVPVSPQAESILKSSISETTDIVLSYQHSVFSLDFASLNYTRDDKKHYSYKLEGFDKDWNYIGKKHSVTFTNLDPGKYTLKVRGLDNDGNFTPDFQSLNIAITPPFYKTILFQIIAGLSTIGFIFLIYSLRMKSIEAQKKNLEREVQIRTSELSQANKELSVQKEAIENQSNQIKLLYTDVKDSIRAAQVLQKAILPNPQLIFKYFPESFIFNKPKDVVSGDFYWFDVVNDTIIMALIDCTGHGISGAFMSINGHHLLNHAIYPYKELVASEILDRLNKSVIKMLNKNLEEYEALEGMDISICLFDMDKKTVQFSGAVQQLYLVRNNNLSVIKGDIRSIGQLGSTGVLKKHSNHVFSLEKGDILYLSSDGFADQIGGLKKDQKFMHYRFRELLTTMSTAELKDHPVLLDETLDHWKGDNEQLDDILIMGLKIT